MFSETPARAGLDMGLLTGRDGPLAPSDNDNDAVG